MRARPTIGVAGGGFGTKVLVPALREAGFEVTAVACRSAARAAALAGDHSVATAVEGWADLLTWPGLDAVALALPPGEGISAADSAVAAGLPVFMEKPFGVHPDRASRIADLAMRGAVPTALDFEYAELQPFVALTEIVRRGDFGRLRGAEVVWNARSAALAAGQWSWKTDLVAGGGALSIYGSHLLHMASLLAEASGAGALEVVEADLQDRQTARFAPAGAVPADERFRLMLQASDGFGMSLAADITAPGDLYQEWVIHLDEATAVLSNRESGTLAGFRLSVVGRDSGVRAVVEDAEAQARGLDVLVARLASRFLGAVREGGTCRPNLDDGAKVQGWIARARRLAGAGGA